MGIHFSSRGPFFDCVVHRLLKESERRRRDLRAAPFPGNADQC